MTAKDILKSWFSTGKKPTGTQFAEWIDSFWHKGEAIKITDVENLQTTLANKVQSTDQRVANAVRYMNGVLTAPDGSTIIVGSDFYFGPWRAGEFNAGWVAISTDGNKFWQALQDHESAAEPVAEDANWKLVFEDTAGSTITIDAELSGVSENPVQNKVIKAKFDSLQINGYETSYYFQGTTEVMDRFVEAVEFTAIDTGTLLSSSVEIAVDGGTYQPLAVGFLVAAGKRFKLRITYATGVTEGVLIIRVKKQ